MDKSNFYLLSSSEITEMIEDDDDVFSSEEEDDILEQRKSDSESEQSCSDLDEVSTSGSFFMGKDRVTRWNKEMPLQTQRREKENIITHLPGPNGRAKFVKTPSECWKLFFDDDILNHIVENTNKYIERIKEKFSRERDAISTNICEIKAFIGILFACAVMKLNTVNLRDIWTSDGFGIEIIKPVMSEKRFSFLIRALRFDDKATRNDRRNTDKLAAVRDFFEKFVTNCQKNYCPSEYLTIDEMLEAFKGRCQFRQYIPSKPSKYGIKIFALTDSRTFYSSNLEVYAGMQPQGQYFTSNSPKDVVLRLCKPVAGSGRNITFDNWFTSYELALKLLDIKLTSVGTLKKNKREIPPEFITSRNRTVFSSMFGFQKKCTLVSYSPKRNKVTLLLSTLHHNNSIDSSTEEKNKPEIVTFYNLTKGGVDVVDKLASRYNCARYCRRWPLVIFYSLLNISAVNSHVIYYLNNKLPQNQRRRHFMKLLWIELMTPQLKLRAQKENLPRNIRTAALQFSKLQHETSESESESTTASTGTSPASTSVASTSAASTSAASTSRKRSSCSDCGYKKGRKTTNKCFRCNKYICGEHSHNLCKSCIESSERTIELES
ncbi:piggyBac transposable element-derived protein 4-like [Centruroides vittatus]|uniref:piggyBac transposable element-derived protein 4-like n=1 Tax=Centruroides vittatus TaxID=120091 RepID=UPI00350F4E44